MLHFLQKTSLQPVCRLAMWLVIILCQYQAVAGAPSPYRNPKKPVRILPIAPKRPARIAHSGLRPADTDPIAFRLQSNKSVVRIGESVELTISAELLSLSPALLFSLPGQNAFKLKLLLPAGFERTGGNFTDYIGDELSASSHSSATYKLIGHFNTVTPGSSFRLLRSHAQATEQSLFVEKAALPIQVVSAPTGDAAAAPLPAAPNQLRVIAETVTHAGARVGSPDYTGQLEIVSCQLVQGWVFDQNNPDQSILIDIYADGKKITTQKANLPRDDVAKHYGTGTYNLYGFSFTVPENLKITKPTQLAVTPAGVSDNILNSPQSVGPCTAPSTAAPTPPPASTTAVAVTPPAGNTTPAANTTPIASTTPNQPSKTQTLVLEAPTYNCQTGQITFNTSGGDGSTIEFQAGGITDWTANPNQYLDRESRTAADTPPFTLKARQNGQTVSYTWSRQKACETVPVSTTTAAPAPALTLLAPQYDCATGRFTFQTNGGDGSKIEFFASGITDWTTNPNQQLDNESRTAADTPPFTLKARQNNQTVSYTWSRQEACGTTPPTTATTTAQTPTSVTPTAATATVQDPVATTTTIAATTTTAPASATDTAAPNQSLTLLAPLYDCATGQLTFQTGGGDGSKIEFFAGGITDWTTNPNQQLDRDSRTATDTPPFTLKARQNNQTVSYTWSRQEACATTPPATTPATPPTQTAVAPSTPVAVPTVDPGQYPTLSSTPPADQRPVLQNERIRVAVDLGVGGVIREVTDLQVGDNMINCMVKPDGKRDAGRDDQISLYGMPDANSGWTQNGKALLGNIGYNPVQGGDIAGNYSPILAFGRSDNMLYTKTRNLLWGMDNEPGDYIVEQWIRLDKNVVKRHVRITGNRPDRSRWDQSRTQEIPCTYTNSSYFQYYVVQGEPYTNAPLVDVNSLPNPGMNGLSLNQRLNDGIVGPCNVNASEPWIAAVNPYTNRGLALHTVHSHNFSAGTMGYVGVNQPESENAGYINNAMNLILDPDGVYEFDINMVVGTLSEIRNTINTLPRSETRPSYVFAGNPTRHGFYYNRGYDQGYPIADELTITPTTRYFKITSPRKGYRASETPTLYVRMRAITTDTQLRLTWRKVGQSDMDAHSAGQEITFEVKGDNQYRTIAIPVGQNPNWSGTISDFSITYLTNSDAPVSDQQFGIKWISANNLGDF